MLSKISILSKTQANLYRQSSKKTCGEYLLPLLKTDPTTIIMSYNFSVFSEVNHMN